MDLYSLTTIILGLCAVAAIWRYPKSMAGFVIFFISYLPLVYRQAFVDENLQVATATFIVATMAGVLQLLRIKKKPLQ